MRRAEVALLETAHADSVVDQLGVATGFESLVRLHRKLNPPSPAAIAKLRALAASSGGRTAGPDPARIRRLALEVLTTAEAADDVVITRAASDPDAQVRRLAMRAAGISAASVHAAGDTDVLTKGLQKGERQGAGADWAIRDCRKAWRIRRA